MQVTSQTVQNGMTVRTVNIDSQGHLARQNGAMSRNGSVFNTNNTNNENRPTTPPEQPVNNDSQSNAKDPGALEGRVSDLKGQISDIEGKGHAMQASGKKAQQTSADIDAQLKSAQQQQKSDLQTINDQNRQLQSLARAQEQSTAQINDAARGLEQAIAEGDMEAFERYSSQLNNNSSIADSYGRKMYTLQKSNTSTIKCMNNANAQFMKLQNSQQACMKQELSAAQQVAQVADAVGQISQVVQIAGTTMVTVGNMMLSNPYTAGPGAVLVNVGTVAQTVGQYGNAAVAITKTCCSAADGDIMGALANGAGALTACASAIETTTALKGTIENANTLAANAKASTDAAKQNADAFKEMGMSKGQGAKELYSQMGNTKYEDASATANNLAGNMQNNYATATGIQGATFNDQGQLVDSEGNRITQNKTEQRQTRAKANGQDTSEADGKKTVDWKGTAATLNKMSSGITMAAGAMSQFFPQQQQQQPCTYPTTTTSTRSSSSTGQERHVQSYSRHARRS